MPTDTPILHLVCGLAAAGKSSLAAELGRDAHTVVIAEDAWLAALFADEMTSIPDYVRYAARLRAIIGPHVTAVLRTGVSVVLDFPANTIENRQWMRRVAEAAGVPHRLHYLDVPTDICMARLRDRNARGDHPFTLTDDQFFRLAKHFVPPSAAEGLEIVVHGWRQDGGGEPDR